MFKKVKGTKNRYWGIGVALLVPMLVTASGGVDGGGGGTLPAQPVDIHTINRIVLESKKDLRLFLNYKDKYYRRGLDPLEDKFFGGPVTIRDILEKVDMEILTDKPCLDAFGNEVDGSVHASRPNTICISAFRIAPKLSKERARVETLGLILHELTHFLDANEEEAVEFQKKAVSYLDETTDRAAGRMTELIVIHTDNMTRDLEGLAKRFDTMTPQEKIKKVDEVLMVYSGFSDYLRERALSLFSFRESQFLDVQMNRLLWLTWYIRGIAGDAQSAYYKLEYEKIFRDAPSITYGEYEQRSRAPSRPNIFPNEVINKIQNSEDLKKQLLLLSSYFENIREYAFAVYANNALPHLKGPWTVATKNPWEEYIGEYGVDHVDCVADGIQLPAMHEVKFKVHKSNEGHVYLGQEFRQMYADLIILDGKTYGSELLTVRNGTQWVERVAEMGARWSSEWTQRTHRLSLVEGEWSLKETFIRRKFTGREYKDSSLVCTYKLTKAVN